MTSLPPPKKLAWAAATFAASAAKNAFARHAPRAFAVAARLGNVTGRGGGRDGAAGAAYFRAVVDDYEAVARRAGVAGPGHALWQGRRVLEIGPGNTRAVGLLARARGASAWEGLDAFDIQARGDAYLDALYGPLLAGEQGAGGPQRAAELLAGARVHTSLAGLRAGGRRFDLVVSRAALEHVMDVDGLFAAVADVVVDGAVLVHKIDLRSHGKELDNPLDFLVFPEAPYRTMSSHLGDMPNRLRAPAWLAVAERHGLRTAWAASTHVASAEDVARARPALAAPFAGMDDDALRVLGLWLVQTGPRHPCAARAAGAPLEPAGREGLSAY